MKILLKNILLHPRHYLILSIGFFIALVFIVIFRFEPYFQQYIIYATVGFYLMWGILHHYRRGDLHLNIILEYLILALLAVLVATGQFF